MRNIIYRHYPAIYNHRIYDTECRVPNQQTVIMCPVHITNYPIFGVAFGINFLESAILPRVADTHPATDDYISWVANPIYT